MIIFVYGPTLAKQQYCELQREIITKLTRKTVDARGFDRKDIRVFFPQMALDPESVEVAIFAGSGMSTTIRETSTWKDKVESVVATYYPTKIINGFVSKLEATAQFTSVTPLARKMA